MEQGAPRLWLVLHEPGLPLDTGVKLEAGAPDGGGGNSGGQVFDCETEKEMKNTITTEQQQVSMWGRVQPENDVQNV